MKRPISTISAAALAWIFFDMPYTLAQNNQEFIQNSTQIIAENKLKQYKVQRGDTLSSIAKKLNISIEDLVRDNNIQNPDKIRAGDILIHTPRIQQQSYLGNLPHYSNIRHLIKEIENKHSIPNDLLHLIVLVESEGHNINRFEPRFKQNHIDNGKFKFDRNKKYKTVFSALKQKNPELTEEEFKTQLAKSVGPAQILYCTAIDLGFRCSLDELRDPECNLEYAARKIHSQSAHTAYSWKKVLNAYNTNSATGKATPGHLKRGSFYKQELEKLKNRRVTFIYRP